MIDYKLALMTGVDIPIPDLQLTLHQPTIKEISYIGEHSFFIGLQTITVNKNVLLQANSLLESTSNFQIFMTIINKKEFQEKKECVTQLFQLVFPKKVVMFTPASIILKEEDILTIIDENSFDMLQKILTEVFCLNSHSAESGNFNPQDAKAKEIAEKLMRGRQRVAQQKGETTGSAFARYISIITIAIDSMSLSETMNLTMYQMYDLIERYSLHLNWDLDIKTRLAGGKPDSKPEDWMKNIH